LTYRLALLLGLLLVLSLAVTRAAHGDVRPAADFAAGNAEAHATNSPGSTGSVVHSPDPLVAA
jgi:hypothetical protein